MGRGGGGGRGQCIYLCLAVSYTKGGWCAAGNEALPLITLSEVRLTWAHVSISHNSSAVSSNLPMLGLVGVAS